MGFLSVLWVVRHPVGREEYETATVFDKTPASGTIRLVSAHLC